MSVPGGNAAPGTVYFVGAGPGAPDLITCRGRDLMGQADLVVYADSLVDSRLVAPARERGARVVGSAELTLEEIVDLMAAAARRGQIVVRLHSGDPSVYGALHEQLVRLDALSVPWEIVPGVPSAMAAAARLGVELTVPGLVQTVIFARAAGRTPVPGRERLAALAAHRATLAIHLSVARVRRVVRALLEGGYPPDTPVAVLYKVTWPDERIITGTLATIADAVRAAGITRHALILVGPALSAQQDAGAARSHLYSPGHAHLFRPARGVSEEKASPPARHNIVLVAVTRSGAELALRLGEALGAAVRVPGAFAGARPEVAYTGSVVDEVRRCWSSARALVVVAAAGIVVRAVAPLLRHKGQDPAVICLDERGRFVVPLVGGHAAGANALAERIARLTGGVAVITTASDVQGRPALDVVAQELGWQVAPGSQLTGAMAALVNGERLALFVDPALPGRVRAQALARLEDDAVVRVDRVDDLADGQWGALLAVTPQRLALPATRPRVVYHPPVLWVGVGCRRGVSADEVVEAVDGVLERAGLARESVAALVTAEAKGDEPGLVEAARRLNLPLRVVAHEVLRRVPAGAVSPSAAREHLGLPGVAEPAALVASGGDLLVPKERVGRCTVAVAIGEGRP